MGNYSYLLKILNGKETLIDYALLKNELDMIGKEYTDSYLYCLSNNNDYRFENNSSIKTFEDFANRINGNKLCGYLTNGTIKKLCKSGLYMSNKDNSNPVMYFEEEGWDRLYYFKFFPGTEKVECGSFAFDFDLLYYENEYFTKNNKIKKEDDDEDDEVYNYVDQKRTDYIKNLCYDKNINWNVHILDYNKTEKINNSDLMLYVMGIRPEDLKKNPEKYLSMLGKI
jgi:hypothetical protein